ncbi:hypothetical protein HPB47_003414 [Ixodes persulcatus]|uniref:Uncharacterized protein n=1 Tax=Ixodes persulcatus TaxID=34615 RepID=A0AC60PIK2_IXOPE|nr:hypothetical protein HPB47_003414 [Ixodes persulcatus]
MRATTALPRLTPIPTLQEHAQLNTLTELVNQREQARILKRKHIPAAAALHSYFYGGPPLTVTLDDIPPWCYTNITTNKTTKLRRSDQPAPTPETSIPQGQCVVYTDAAVLPRGGRVAFVSPSHPGIQATCNYNSVLVSVENIDEAEEAAVALALTIATSRTKQATITSDSRTAISNFGDGKVGKAARKILQKKTPQTGSRFSLTWVPGHSGHSENEEAHALVTRAQQIRATSCRATTDGDHCYGASPYDRGPRAYNDILRSIRMQRKFMGAPHKRLSRTQESTWRRLQLHNTLTPRMLSRIWPDLFSDKCEECGGVEGGWAHTYWMCPSNPIPATLQSRLDDQDEDLPWCVLLAAEDYETQLAVILRTLEIEHRLKTRLSERRSLPYSPP